MANEPNVRSAAAAYKCECGPNEYCAADDCHGATVTYADWHIELEARQNELHLAMGVVESMPASEAQTACIVKLGERMRKLVELLGKSEVGRSIDV